MTQAEVTLDVVPVQFCRILAEVIRRILREQPHQAFQTRPADEYTRMEELTL